MQKYKQGYIENYGPDSENLETLTIEVRGGTRMIRLQGKEPSITRSKNNFE